MSKQYPRKWSSARRVFLRGHPLCRYCEQMGRLTPANVVDHIIPHKGDSALFWDQTNWQPLCTYHHNSTKQSEERTGEARGCTADGVPISQGHHWAAS